VICLKVRFPTVRFVGTMGTIRFLFLFYFLETKKVFIRKQSVQGVLRNNIQTRKTYKSTFLQNNDDLTIEFVKT
jgi:hypothetical protein